MSRDPLDSIFPAAQDPRSRAVAEEVAAARQSCALANISNLDVVELSGNDALRFLHGQCTQEVKAKKQNEGGYAFLLDARGRNLGDFRFIVRDDVILCLLDRARVAPMAAWLDRFVIAADVRIKSGGWHGILVTGPRSGETLKAALGADTPAEEHAAAPARLEQLDVLVVGDRISGGEGFDVWAGPPAGATTIHAVMTRLVATGARPISATSLEILRIEAGRPLFGVDLDETVLPEESGQGDRAVSYTKGCYSGQEVVAKQKHLGKPRKMLAGVLLDRDVATPTPLFNQNDDEVGRLTSSVYSPTLLRTIGLAMLKWPAPKPGDVVWARAGTKSLPLEVSGLPFIRPSSS